MFHWPLFFLREQIIMGIYRIYSRISREILVIFWQIFLQFDLYAGHKICCPNTFFLAFLCKKSLVHYFKSILIFWNFGPFLANIFSIRLIRGSTYTRVYTVISRTVELSSCRAVLEQKKRFFFSLLCLLKLFSWLPFGLFETVGQRKDSLALLDV